MRSFSVVVAVCRTSFIAIFCSLSHDFLLHRVCVFVYVSFSVVEKIRVPVASCALITNGLEQSNKIVGAFTLN